jgi:hypothetical protein
MSWLSSYVTVRWHLIRAVGREKKRILASGDERRHGRFGSDKCKEYLLSILQHILQVPMESDERVLARVFFEQWTY